MFLRIKPGPCTVKLKSQAVHSNLIAVVIVKTGHYVKQSNVFQNIKVDYFKIVEV